MDKLKIFVTLGTQKFQFNRLLIELDKLDMNRYDINAQIGYSTYVPKFYSYTDFFSREQFVENVKNADLIITHAGTGAIITSLKSGKPVIAVARLKKYNEHVDNHQLELLDLFTEKNYIKGLVEINDLDNVIKDTMSSKFDKFVSNTDNFISGLIKLIES